MRQTNRIFPPALNASESLPGVPLIEIVGQGRVLIEYHLGVIMYSVEEICVKVKYGMICVCGCGLQLARMTKQQLVITGNIEDVKLLGGQR